MLRGCPRKSLQGQRPAAFRGLGLSYKVRNSLGLGGDRELCRRSWAPLGRSSKQQGLLEGAVPSPVGVPELPGAEVSPGPPNVALGRSWVSKAPGCPRAPAPAYW